MARTEIAVQTMPVIEDGLAAEESVKTFTALTGSSGSSGNSCAFTGREIVEVRNTGATGHSFTISSVADNLGRTGDITETIDAGEHRHYQFSGTEGWRQSDGQLYFEGDDAELEVAVVRPKK